MAGKDLTFKLVMDADVKTFIKNLKDAENQAKELFDRIRQQSDRIKQSTSGASGGIDQLGRNFDQTRQTISRFQRSVGEIVTELETVRRGIDANGNSAAFTRQQLEQFAAKASEKLRGYQNQLNDARLELNRLSATSASPADIDKARQKVRELENGINQVTRSLEGYQNRAKISSETPPIPTNFQRQVGSLVTELENVGRALDQDGNSANHTRQQLEQLANRATAQLQIYERQLVDARLELNRLSATNASPADIEKAKQRVRELQNGINQVSNSLDGYRNRARIANNEVVSSTNRATESIDRLRSSYGLLRTTITTLAASLAVLGVGLSAKSLADTADSYAALSARIKISIGDSGNFQQAMAGVHQAAIMTNSSLDTTGELFYKINDASKQMGLSQTQVLGLTKTINQAVKLGGGSIESTNAALIQFNQSLQSGVFRGEEFASVSEQAPVLLKAIADGLNVTTGELRNMAGEGKLSASVVLEALQKSSKGIQENFNKLPPTIGVAIQRIKTQWEILIGTMDQSNGTSATVAKWMMTIADNMDVVQQLLKDVGSGFVWIGDKLSKIDVATIQALKDALGTAYDTLKTTLSTMSDLGVVFDDVFNTALDSLLGFSSGAEEAESKTNGFTKVLQVINVALGLLSDGFSGIGISVKLFTGLLYDMASAWFQVKSKFTWGDVRKQAIADMEAMQKKAREYYTSAGNDADKFESKAKIAYDNIGKTQQQRNNESVASAKDAMDKILAIKRQQKESIEKLNAEDQAKAEKLEDDKLKAVENYVKKSMDANKGVLDGMVQADLLTKGYIVTVDEAGKVAVKAWTDAKASTQEQAAAIQKAKDAENEYNTFVQTSAAKRVEINQQIVATKASGDLTALNSAKQALAQIDIDEQALLAKKVSYANQAANAAIMSNEGIKNASKEAAKTLGIDLDVALNKVSKSFTTGSEQVDKLARGMAALGATGEQSSNIIYAGWSKWLETAKSQAEIDVAKSKLEEFGKSGQLSASQVDAGLLAIKLRAAELPNAIDPVTQAFERLGIKTKEQLALSAQSALADFNTILASGKATAESIKQAYERTMQSAVASGDQTVIAMAKAKAASAGLNVEIDNTGKVTVQTTREIVDAMSSVAVSANNADNGIRMLGESAADQANKVKDAWDGVSDSIDKVNEKSSGAIAVWYSQDVIKSKLKEINPNMSDDEISKLSAKIYNQTKGMDYTGAANASQGYLQSKGYSAAQIAIAQSTPNISNIEAVNEQLDIYAKKFAAQTKAAELSAKVAEQAAQSQKTDKTVRFEIINGQRTATVYGDAKAGTDLEGVMSQLETLKKAGA